MLHHLKDYIFKPDVTRFENESQATQHKKLTQLTKNCKTFCESFSTKTWFSEKSLRQMDNVQPLKRNDNNKSKQMPVETQATLSGDGIQKLKEARATSTPPHSNL